MGGQTNQGDEGSDACDQVKNKRCLRKRSSWVNYGLLDVSSDEEFVKVFSFLLVHFDHVLAV